MPRLRTAPAKPRLFASIVGALCLAGPAGAAATPPAHPGSGRWLERATQAETDAVVNGNTPGVVVLRRDGRRTTSFARGQAQLEPSRPLRPGTTFRAGSITKTLVATVVMRLVDRGRIRLDDTVERWLPGLVSDGASITIRELLGQTSGLAEYSADPRIDAPYETDPNYSYPLLDLAKIAVDRPRTAAPGTAWGYANTNYVLLGLVIEAATHRPWTAAVEAQILRPLGMRHSAFPSTASLPRGASHGYVPSAGGLLDVTDVSPTFVGSAGTLISTADDLSTFLRALLSGALVGPESLRLMTTASPLAVTAGLDYGLGIFHIRTACGDVWGHDGELLGNSSLAFSSRDGRRQVVVLANAGQPSPEQTEARIRLMVKAYCAG